MNAETIKRQLNLARHPVEGGYFHRTYTSDASLDLSRGARAQASAIYYLLERGLFSEMHTLSSDEMFHFYLGDPLEMLHLYPDGTSSTFILGSDLEAGQHVQLLVPAGVWQGMRLIGDGSFALVGCTVSPGFDFADYRSGFLEELSAGWPDQTEMIRELTRH